MCVGHTAFFGPEPLYTSLAVDRGSPIYTQREIYSNTHTHLGFSLLIVYCDDPLVT